MKHPDPEYRKLQARLTRLFHKACADYALIEDGDHILVGLSGGKDSLALVELLGKRAQIFVPHFTVTAVHVRVKERPYLSDLDYLQSFCTQVKVPLLVRDTSIGDETGEKDPCFLCSWYRRKELFKVADELGCNKIALGHHKDDIVETLLMNLFFQGHFSTIRPKLQMDKMPLQLIRPLCLIDESDLSRYAVLSGYVSQKQPCPFEQNSHRADIKRLVAELRQLNPNIADSVIGAVERHLPSARFG